MLITTTRRHLCLIFLKTAGAILLFQVARANWPATRTKLTANTFQVKISKYKLKISLTRPTMKEEEKSARAEAFSSLLELQHGMSCRNRMSYIHDPAEKSIFAKASQFKCFMGYLGYLVVKNWVLDNGGPKVLAILDWYSSKSHQIKSTHPPRVGRLQHAV